MHNRTRWLTVAELLCWWAASLGLWLLTLSSVSPSELAVAIVCGLPCALAARAGRRATGGAWLPRPVWLGWLAVLPASVVADSARLAALLPRAARGRAHPGRLRGIQLPRAEPGPVRRARHALGTLALSASPAAIVVDSDPENGTLLVHSFRSGRPHLDRVVAR
jgi:multisubunit Na+/H+ antiporter MnhE subunit